MQARQTASGRFIESVYTMTIGGPRDPDSIVASTAPTSAVRWDLPVLYGMTHAAGHFAVPIEQLPLTQLSAEHSLA